MKAFRTLYRANLTEFLSNRRALFLTIAFPVLFITIFGLVFTNQDKADARIGVACATPDDAVAKAIFKAFQDVTHRDMNGDGGHRLDRRREEPVLRVGIHRRRRDGPARRPAARAARCRHHDSSDLGDKAADAKERALKAAAEEQRDMQDMADLMEDDDKTGKPSSKSTPAAVAPTPSPAPTASPASTPGPDTNVPAAPVAPDYRPLPPDTHPHLARHHRSCARRHRRRHHRPAAFARPRNASQHRA